MYMRRIRRRRRENPAPIRRRRNPVRRRQCTVKNNPHNRSKEGSEQAGPGYRVNGEVEHGNAEGRYDCAAADPVCTADDPKVDTTSATSGGMNTKVFAPENWKNRIETIRVGHKYSIKGLFVQAAMVRKTRFDTAETVLLTHRGASR